MAYDKEFFVDLALQGKEKWNEWRRTHEGVRATFNGIDFSGAPRDQINFEGFEFGDEADFRSCKWRGAILGDFRQVRAVFGNNTQFLSAAFGHDANFGHAVFGTAATFDCATFGNDASFYRTAFGSYASFVRTAFGGMASFKRATFGNDASFWHAAFANRAIFYQTVFGGDASFEGAFFDSDASFDSVFFRSHASFASATFGTGACFENAAFGNDVSFIGAAFGSGARFKNSSYKGRVQFDGKSMEQWIKDFELSSNYRQLNPFESLEKVKEARGVLESWHKGSWTRFGSGPDRLLTISFEGARFDGKAVFSRRSFEGDADFTNARFYRPPDFDPASKDARIDFTGAHIGFVRPGRIHWTCETKVPLRLRALRKIAEETKNHDLERDLYVEERKAERGVYLRQRFLAWVRDPKRKWALTSHIIWILVMGVYWALADYGRSFVRPLAWLIASGFFFYWRYIAVLGELMAKAPDVDKYKQAVGMLALGNAVPFVGPLTIDSEIKKLLFCPSGADYCLPPIPPEGFNCW